MRELRFRGEGVPRTGDGGLVRSVNRDLILDELAARGRASRASIAKATGLNKATVSSQVAELVAAGLVRETGIGSAELGRKPVMLELDGAAGYALGLGLSASSIRLVARDLAGRRLASLEEPLASTEPTAVRAALAAAVSRYVAGAAPSRYGLVGIGVSVPGVVDAGSQLVVRAARLGWSSVELRSGLEAAFGCPAIVGNDAKLATAAEYAEGGLEGDILCVLVGEGIGVGAYLGGKPYAGPRGYFGEAGHMTVAQGGRPCPCGNRGCWDAYASEGAFLADLAQAAPRPGSGPGSLAEAIELIRAGAPWAGEFLEEYADRLASGLVGLVNLFAPAAIVLNSELLAALPGLFASVAAKTAARTMAYNGACALRLSSLGPAAPVLGAAMAAADRFLDEAVADLEALAGRCAAQTRS
jgi:predicted NBD/HSP70 family sugar kinase